MKRAALVTGMALAVMAMTPSARGDDAKDAVAPAQQATAPASTETPLALRPTHPVELAKESPASTWGTKAFLVALLAAGGYVAWKRRALVKPSLDDRGLRIVARRGVGVRSELLVVDVDGQSLLLGVTAGNIQTLATLSPPVESAERDGEADVVRHERRDGAPPAKARPAANDLVASIPHDRFAKLLREATNSAAPPPRETRAARETRDAPKEARESRPSRTVEGQVSGLASFRGDR